MKNADTLKEYVSLGLVVEALKKEADDMEETLEILNAKIEKYEQLGLTETVDDLCKEYIELNLKRIDLEIQYHEYSIKQLKFARELAEE